MKIPRSAGWRCGDPHHLDLLHCVGTIAFEPLAAIKNRGGKLVVVLAGLLLVILSAAKIMTGLQPVQHTIHQLDLEYRQMGEIARNYIASIGSEDTVYVVSKAHWVDTVWWQ